MPLTIRENCFWNVVVAIRQRDAQGIVWDRSFCVDCPTDATRDEIKLRWLELYSLEWELFHIVSYQRS